MSPLVFLVAVVVLSLLGGLALWLRDRAPRSMEAHMRAFERELQALSPETELDAGPRKRRPADRPRPRGPSAG